jgi:predicted membrane protein
LVGSFFVCRFESTAFVFEYLYAILYPISYLFMLYIAYIHWKKKKKSLVNSLHEKFTRTPLLTRNLPPNSTHR